MLCVDQECCITEKLGDAITRLITADLSEFDRRNRLQLLIAKRWDEARIGIHVFAHLPRIFWLCRDLRVDVLYTNVRSRGPKDRALEIVDRVIEQLDEEGYGVS